MHLRQRTFAAFRNRNFALFFAGQPVSGRYMDTADRIQMETDDRMRGCAMGYVVLAFFGMLPLGSLLISAPSQQIGAP
jgi:hypothetical protein